MINRADVINKIIHNNGMKHVAYLEIGVWAGDTFKYVNAETKDGVDPGQYCDCNYVNYKMTSDVFFKTYINKGYDIIFIDGLHTAYQVSKDIYNSINNLNDGGWIILDDVFPHCENEQERLNLNKCGSQTGDVWKALYNVLDVIVEISDAIYFVPYTERGSFVFKVKTCNDINITIDETIPTCNNDGWYIGNDAEWNKYSYKNDFASYLQKLKSYNSIV